MPTALESLESRTLLAASVTTIPLPVAGDVSVTAFEVDRSGDLIVTGTFVNVVDFNPSPRRSHVLEAPSPSGAVFVARYTADGRPLWVQVARPRLADQNFLATAVTLDERGDVYVAGQLQGPADFDPGPRRHVRTSEGFADPANRNIYDTFVWRLRGDGRFVSTAMLNVNGVGDEQATSARVDHAGNVYLAGRLGHNPPGGQWDGFVAKLTPAGRQVWVSDVGPGAATDMALDALGRPHVISDAGVTQLTGRGNVVWQRRFDHPAGTGSGGAAAGTSLDLDRDGNVYVAGAFSGVIDFDPGPGVFALRGSPRGQGTTDAFVAKLDRAGRFKFAEQFGGAGFDRAGAVRVSRDGDVYVSGYYIGSADFNPGKGQFLLDSGDHSNAAGGVKDAFLVRLDHQGKFLTAQGFGQHYEPAALPLSRLTRAGSPLLLLDSVWGNDPNDADRHGDPIQLFRVEPE